LEAVEAYRAILGVVAGSRHARRGALRTPLDSDDLARFPVLRQARDAADEARGDVQHIILMHLALLFLRLLLPVLFIGDAHLLIMPDTAEVAIQASGGSEEEVGFLRRSGQARDPDLLDDPLTKGGGIGIAAVTRGGNVEPRSTRPCLPFRRGKR